MDSRKVVGKEVAIVLLGQIICLGAMLGIYALLGYFSIKVLLGGLVGSFLSVANFFFLAIGTSLAADKAAQEDTKGGKNLVRTSYFLRMAVLFIVLFACGKSGYFEPISLVVPLLFVRPVLFVAEFFRKSGEKKA